MVWLCVGCVLLMCTAISGMAVWCGWLIMRETDKNRQFLADLASKSHIAGLALNEKDYVAAEVSKESAMLQLDALEKDLAASAKKKIEDAPAVFMVDTSDGKQINIKDSKWEFI